jgi:hypothetical protein
MLHLLAGRHVADQQRENDDAEDQGNDIAHDSPMI